MYATRFNLHKRSPCSALPVLKTGWVTDSHCLSRSHSELHRPDALLEGTASRGVEPAQRETYSNGVRKVTYRDPDGNEIGYGGSPAG